MRSEAGNRMSPQGASNLGQVDMEQRLSRDWHPLPLSQAGLGVLQVSGSIREGNPIAPGLSSLVFDKDASGPGHAESPEGSNKTCSLTIVLRLCCS